MLLPMIGIPKLRCDKDIFAFDNTISYCLSYTVTNFLFIAIVTGGVEAPVAGSQCVLDHLAAEVVGDLPQTQTH
jgi:hypothetical protein